MKAGSAWRSSLLIQQTLFILPVACGDPSEYRRMTLRIVPVTLRAAQAFVELHHRHNKPARGWKFGVGVEVELAGLLVGVATAGRPVARHFDDGFTLEVNRTCTDGSRNANSMLYGAVWRCARAMGYLRCITYTQGGETGASLRAAGWAKVRDIAPRPGWDRPGRPREDIGSAMVARQLWQIEIKQ